MFGKIMFAVPGIATILLSATLLPQVGMAQLAPYDDFNSRYIDPAKWNGSQNYDPDLREGLRQVVHDKNHGRLRIAQTAYSSTKDDTGGSGGVFGLSFPAPDAITEISFAVTVTQATAVGCSSNDALIVTDAEFRGTFFNTENAPTDQIGNVTAVIGLEHTPLNPGKSLIVSGFVTRCEDQYCSNQSSLSYRVLGSVRVGQEARLRLKWDQVNHRFLFQLNDGLRNPRHTAYLMPRPRFHPTRQSTWHE